mgnify:CR=1 FL=1
MLYEKKPNYLLNAARYAKKDTASRFGTSQGQRSRALSQAAGAKDDAKTSVTGYKTPAKDANRKASKDQKFYTVSQNLNQTQIDLIKQELSLSNKELTP